LDIALKVLRNVEEIGICELTSQDVVRHPVVQKIVKAYEDYEKRAGKTSGTRKNRSGQNRCEKQEREHEWMIAMWQRE
jgi:phosphate starvation-inducible PhoH-like protein